jgi:DNA-binding MarR family transcriptional regulator
MPASDPLPFDPIDRAAQIWSTRIGESDSMAAVTSVFRVQQILQQAVDTALRPHELTFARYEALVLLRFAKTGALPMSLMGQRLQLHPTSITNIVDRLEAAELVRRRPHPTDKRTTLVEITEAGRRRGEEATESVMTIGFGLVGLSDDEVSSLTGLLAKVRQAAGDFT